MTNGDIIRSMDDKLLAEFMANERYRTVKPFFEYCGCGIEKQVIYAKLLAWMKEEVV